MNTGGTVHILDLLAGGRMIEYQYNLDISRAYGRMVRGEIGPKGFAAHVWLRLKKHPKVKNTSFNGDTIDKERSNLMMQFKRFSEYKQAKKIHDVHVLIQRLQLWGQMVLSIDPVIHNCCIVLIEHK